MEPTTNTTERGMGVEEPLVWILCCDGVQGRRIDSFLKEHDLLRRHDIYPEFSEVIGLLQRGDRPDVMIVDICESMADRVAMIGKIHAMAPSTRLIVIAKNDDEGTLVGAICAGATGYLIRGTSTERIVSAIREIMAGGTPMDPGVAHKLLSLVVQIGAQQGDYSLTDRERDVLRLVAEGRAKKEIAEALFISYFTVDTHLKNIYEKLNVHSQGAAISKAFKEHLLYRR